MLVQVESELGPGRRIVNAPPKRRPVQYEVSTCFIRLSFVNVEGKGVIEHEKITRAVPSCEGHKSKSGVQCHEFSARTPKF